MVSVLAPLIRGLCINAAQASRIVIAGTAPAPKNALSIDLESAFVSDDGGTECFNEKNAAKALSEAYAAWEFETSPSAGETTAVLKKQPSAITVKRGTEPLGVFWIDRDLDSVRRRRKNGDDSFIEESIAPEHDTETVLPGLCSHRRSAVVENRVAAAALGSARGIGEDICTGLAASGALVFIAAADAAEAEELAQKINDRQGKTAAIAVRTDVTNEKSIEALFDTVAKEAGGLDLFINTTEEFHEESLLRQELTEFKLSAELNYVGYFITAKFASRMLSLQHLCAPRWKTDIIQIGSKAGGIGLTAGFALELIDYNIKINSICPGDFFDSALWSDPEQGIFARQLKDAKVPGARNIADVRAFYEAKIPMKRGCEGPDIMRAIYYIIEQEYETGQVLPVSGGQVMLR